jgi:hypothetical protein
MVGQRNGNTTNAFIADLASRINGRIQLITDGYQPYVDAVELAFGRSVNFATLVKSYTAPATTIGVERRLQPGRLHQSR